MISKTALYERHLAAGGKLVDFAGWSLPINYGSQINEHHQVRRDAGMFDVSHMCVSDVRGPAATAYLQHLLANDVMKLQKAGQALYSCMLNEAGGVIDDLIVYRTGSDQYRIVSNAATRDKDMRWMQQQRGGFDCDLLELSDYAMLAVQGPEVREKLLSTLPAGLSAQVRALQSFTACWTEELFIACTGYTGEDGFEIILPAEQAGELWDQLLACGVAPIGLGARDSLRLEAGMSLYGNDLDEQHSPLESGLNWTVAWQPEARQFVGRDALQSAKTHGSETGLVGLVLEDRGVLRAGQKVYIEAHESGMITSGGFSPSLGVAIALARIEKSTSETVEVEIRGRRLTARVVKLPFVRRGQSCIAGHEYVGH